MVNDDLSALTYIGKPLAKREKAKSQTGVTFDWGAGLESISGCIVLLILTLNTVGSCRVHSAV